jgi:hypothetical protein
MSMRRLAIVLLMMGFASAPVCAQQTLIDTLRAADQHWLEQAKDLLKGVKAKDFVAIELDASGPKTLQVGALRVAGSHIRKTSLVESKFKIEIISARRKVIESLIHGTSATVQIVRFDQKTKLPQVLILAPSGGSGHWVGITVFDGGRDGMKWRRHDQTLDCCKRSELALDLFHDGNFYVVHYGRGEIAVPGWTKMTSHNAERMQLMSFRNGRFIDGASPEKLRRVYLHLLREWYDRVADDQRGAAWRIDVDNEAHQELALSYVQMKAGLGEAAQAWSIVSGPMGFSRNRQFLEEARKALLEAKYVRDASQLPLPAR